MVGGKKRRFVFKVMSSHTCELSSWLIKNNIPVWYLCLRVHASVFNIGSLAHRTEEPVFAKPSGRNLPNLLPQLGIISSVQTGITKLKWFPKRNNFDKSLDRFYKSIRAIKVDTRSALICFPSFTSFKSRLPTYFQLKNFRNWWFCIIKLEDCRTCSTLYQVTRTRKFNLFLRRKSGDCNKFVTVKIFFTFIKLNDDILKWKTRAV